MLSPMPVVCAAAATLLVPLLVAAVPAACFDGPAMAGTLEYELTAQLDGSHVMSVWTRRRRYIPRARRAPDGESADDAPPLFSASSRPARLPPRFRPNLILAQVNRGSRSRGGVPGDGGEAASPSSPSPRKSEIVLLFFVVLAASASPMPPSPGAGIVRARESTEQ